MKIVHKGLVDYLPTFEAMKHLMPRVTKTPKTNYGWSNIRPYSPRAWPENLNTSSFATIYPLSKLTEAVKLPTTVPANWSLYDDQFQTP